MLWKDRILSAVLAIAVAAAATAAVVRFAPEKIHITPAQLEEGITGEAIDLPAGEIVVTVDGNGAEAELYTFWFNNECTTAESRYGVDLASSWDEPANETDTWEEFLRKDTLEAVKQQLVIENLAARYGVTLTAEDEAALAAQREQTIEQLGEEGYRELLYKNGISEAGYDRISRMYPLLSHLYELYNTPGSEFYRDDDELYAYAGPGYLTADHILIATIDLDTREPLDEETAAQKKDLAVDILAQLRASEDPVALFDELADEYSEDTGRVVYPRGYTFTPDGYAITASGLTSFVPEYLETALTLEEGQISDIVESVYGYHIILRRPLDVSLVADTVRDRYFEILIIGEVGRAEAIVDPSIEEIDLRALYTELRAAQNEE